MIYKNVFCLIIFCSIIFSIHVPATRADLVEDQIISEHLYDIPILKKTASTIPTKIWYEFRLIPRKHLELLDGIIFEDSPGAYGGLIVLAYTEFTLDGYVFLHVPVQSVMETSIIHEVGHAIQCAHIDKFENFGRSDPNDCVTHYACSNPEEDFAESYRMYLMDREYFKRIAPRSQHLTKKYEYMKKMLGEPEVNASSFGISRLYNDYKDENIYDRDICEWFKPEKRDLSQEESLKFSLSTDIDPNLTLPTNQKAVLAIEMEASDIGDVYISGFNFDYQGSALGTELTEASLYDDLGRFLGKGIINGARGNVLFTQITPRLVVKARGFKKVYLSVEINEEVSDSSKLAFSFEPSLENIYAEDRDEYLLEDQQLLSNGEKLETEIELEQKKPNLPSFPDLPEGHKNYQAITYLAQKGILVGYQDGTFKPDKAVSRAELLKILMQSSGINPGTDTNSNFSDLIEGHWSVPYISKALKEGWINGYEDGTFKANKTVSKIEALKIISNILALQIPKPQEGQHWSVPYISFFQNNNLLEEGLGDQMSRSSVAEVIYRCLTLIYE